MNLKKIIEAEKSKKIILSVTKSLVKVIENEVIRYLVLIHYHWYFEA